ncbi:MAG: tetratricopeptide repeat protein [Candidatus Competibacteraceae bacterium]|nr:tetratricopeptide repeat protein [Candidatus Competibacteraceae bacterium]
MNNLTRRYGEKSNKLGPVLLALGSIQEAEGNHAAAMTYYQRALNINEKNYGTYSPEFADNLARAGRTSYKVGDISSARKYYKQSINSLTKQPGLAASENLKKLLKDYKDLNIGEDNSNQELIKDFKQEIYGDTKEEKPKQKSDTTGSTSAFQQETAFKLKASTQGQVSEDPQVILRGIAAPTVQASQKVMAPVYKTMNETIFNQSHFERGEAYYERKIAIDLQALGGEHPSLANDLSGLAVFYISKQQYEKARPLLLRALPIYEKAYGQDNILTVNTRASLASVEFHLGNTELASSLYKRALSQGQSLSPNSLETARILNDLAYLYFQRGKLQDSCTFYEWALASTEAPSGKKIRCLPPA